MLVPARCFLVLSLLLGALAQQNATTDVTPMKNAYTPKVGSCPDGFKLVRSAGITSQTLSPDEVAYVSARQSQVLPGAWKSYLQNVEARNLSLPDYVSSILGGSAPPTLGLATSGGGYRAAIFGAGVMNALDGRNDSSKSVGTGGLLQAATYFSGLSGGSWLLTSEVQAGFPPIHELIFGPSTDGSAMSYGGWNAQFDIIQPNNDTAKDLAFILGVVGEISGKHAAGFPVTIADLWARLLARHFTNGTHADEFFNNTGTTHGAGELFSQIANMYAHLRSDENHGLS